MACGCALGRRITVCYTQRRWREPLLLLAGAPLPSHLLACVVRDSHQPPLAPIVLRCLSVKSITHGAQDASTAPVASIPPLCWTLFHCADAGIVVRNVRVAPSPNGPTFLSNRMPTSGCSTATLFVNVNMIHYKLAGPVLPARRPIPALTGLYPIFVYMQQAEDMLQHRSR